MSTFYAVSLIEHPGHPDQKVHGRRHTVAAREPIVSVKQSGGKATFSRERGVFSTGRGERTYTPTVTSAKRLKRTLAAYKRRGKAFSINRGGAIFMGGKTKVRPMNGAQKRAVVNRVRANRAAGKALGLPSWANP